MIRKRRHSLQKQLQLNKGFTLVELLVVIAIMAIVIGGSAIGVSVISRGNVKKQVISFIQSLIICVHKLLQLMQTGSLI